MPEAAHATHGPSDSGKRSNPSLRERVGALRNIPPFLREIWGTSKRSTLLSLGLRVTLNSRDVSVESVSGDIVLSGRLDGEVHAESVSGEITIDTKGERLTRLATATVSGDVHARVALADGATVKSETVSGEITLVLPKSLSARVDGETFSGDLDIPGAEVHRPKYGPGASVDHRYGSGSANIRIESFSGDARIELE